MDVRLEKAKELGATHVINSNGMSQVLLFLLSSYFFEGKDTAWIKEEVLKLTDGDGAGTLIECTGAPPIVNAMFSFLRKGTRNSCNHNRKKSNVRREIQIL